eukprot:5776219-Lingulodinium_polyedra.AAC.1
MRRLSQTKPCPGNTIALQYVPASLLLRIPGVPWIFPTRESLWIPPGVSRRWLFQFRPSTAYL